MTRFVVKCLKGNKLGIVGTVSKDFRDQWRFMSMTSAHGGSRKAWPTAKRSIPRWAKPGYIVQEGTAERALALVKGYRDGVMWAVFQADQIEMLPRMKVYR